MRTKTLIAIAGVIFAFIALANAGNSDYENEVIYTMPNDTYQAMKADGMTDAQIAKEYTKDNARWNEYGIRWTNGK